MSARAKLPRTITIPADSILVESDRDQSGAIVYQIVIPIGVSRFAKLLIGEEDLRALNLCNPTPVIL